MAKILIILITVFRATVVCGDPIVQHDIVPLSPREHVVELYMSQLGVREEGGNNRGPQIAKYLASTGLGEGHAWCAAFTKWVHQEAGIPTPGATAWSPSWFPRSRTIFQRESTTLTQSGKPGDVFGIWFNNLSRIAHVGFVHEWKDNYVITVEGNTNEAGSREGDGVYKKKRLKRQIYAVSDWINTM